ncbi:MAG: encapsulin-associated ferritin-like protein [Polyangiaceae bacterium]
MAHEGYHEPYELLSDGTRNMHRALVSLQEELEAVDWYQQRADVCTDPELRAVLVHNKDEEIEHAAMTLEWIRRNNAKVDADLATYIGSSGPITQVEAAAEGKAGGGAGPGGAGGGREPRSTSASSSRPSGSGGASPSLGIGSLKPEKA